MLFPVVMCGCESWTIEKAEIWRINAFELWCWIRLLRVPWTTRRSNQSILKEINPNIHVRTDVEADAPILSPHDAKSWLIGKDPHVGKIKGKNRRGWRQMRWLNGITDSVDMNLSKIREKIMTRSNTEELMLSNCGAGEDSWESLGLQGDQTSQY